MLLPYLVGLFIGNVNDRTNKPYYQHRYKIINLEQNIKEYERVCVSSKYI